MQAQGLGCKSRLQKAKTPAEMLAFPGSGTSSQEILCAGRRFLSSENPHLSASGRSRAEEIERLKVAEDLELLADFVADSQTGNRNAPA